MSEGSLCALFADAPQLERLWLGGTPAAERTLEAVSETLPRLRSLSLQGCVELSDGALPLLLLGCPELQVRYLVITPIAARLPGAAGPRPLAL